MTISTAKSPTNKEVYSQMIDDMPPGLPKAILRVIGSVKGKENAITADYFLRCVRLSAGCGRVSNRQLRKSISNLRKAGHMICSLPEDGYYMATSRDEYEEFKRVYSAYAFDILETVKAMDTTADQVYGTDFSRLQPGLF